MRRILIVASFALVAAATMAALPSGVENAIRSWFGPSGKVERIDIHRTSRTITARFGDCTVYNDVDTGLSATCNGEEGTVLTVLAAALGCTQDGNGNLTCNSFASRDQNSQSPAAANRLRVYDNDVDLTPNPSCADYGAAGIFTLIDVDESSNDVWMLCDGTREYQSSSVEYPFGMGQDDVAQVPAANECVCIVGHTNGWIKDLNNIEVDLTTADGVTTGTSGIGIFSIDGQTRYYNSGSITTGFQATGLSTIANAITTPPPIPPGQVLVCLAADTNSAEVRLRGTIDSGAPVPKMAAFTTTGSGCNAGAIPTTLTPTLTYVARAPWYISLSGL